MLYDEQLAFKGGTYLWFFHGLPRFSEDLDFTAVKQPSSKILSKVSDGLNLFGVTNEARMESDDNKSLSFKIMAHGPLYTNQNSRCVVYIEISNREKVIRRATPLRLDLPEYQLPVRILMGMDLDEVAAEKIRAIMSRIKARDVYDLYYLIKTKNVKFNRELVEAKLEYIEKNFSPEGFMDALNSKSEIFEKELSGMVFRSLPSFEEASDIIGRWSGI